MTTAIAIGYPIEANLSNTFMTASAVDRTEIEYTSGVYKKVTDQRTFIKRE